PGQSSIRVPVENRYAFTDFRELTFAWECNADKGTVAVALPPAMSGHIEIPVPAAAKEGDSVRLRITDAKGELINVLAIQLGQAKPAPLPAADGGIPRWSEDDNTILVRGKSYGLVIDRSAGALRADDSRNQAPARQLPALHLTRFDFGDLKVAPPYAMLPEADKRVVESVTAREEAEMLAITVKDRYALFDGAITWRIDADGMGTVSYDYSYSGDELFVREIGVRWLLQPACDELHWRRWSEWDTFPADHIGRTEGQAKARRPAEWPDAPEYVRPRWPWAMDQTELGTNDFRGSKFNIYEALLTAPDGSGLRVHARADAHVRACLDTQGVAFHVLSTCRLAPVVLHRGDQVSGRFCVQLTAPKAQKN
ncbi:MAG: hypothetical protein JXA69_18720, partial [Phycisphaerae bacterium]|nr:hypothetical protein [Phycisphaerae bacterium]